ncbi:MAG: cyclic nucleotide-binding domain-containing protein [Gemmataceae bacterium]
MSQSEVPSAPTCHPFLQGLPEPQRTRLAAAARPFTAAPGEYLLREGEPADAFYLIQSGQAAIGTQLGERGAVPIQTVGSGDVVGWSWLLLPYQWQFDARAMNTVQGWVFDAAWLRDQCEQDQALGYPLLKQLLAVVSSRLAAARVQRLDIYR